MQPEQPTPNYDFIMNPSQPPKQRSPLGGGSLAMRLLVVIGGIFVVIVVIVLALKLFTGGSGVDKSALVGAAQDQTELIRLATNGVQNSSSQASKNFSITTQLSITSEQQALLTYMADNDVKPKPKELTLKQDAQADTQLADAKSSSTFDSVYKSVMQQKLQTYQSDLQRAYQGAGPNGKKLLSARFDAAELLKTQLASSN